MNEILIELKKLSNPQKKEKNYQFFRAFLGGYGEGDEFLGITVPDQRKVAQKFKDIDEKTLTELINSKYHEARLTGIFILVEKYKKSKKKNSEIIPKTWVDFYLNHKSSINNWDLVDSSSPYILGDYLINAPQKERKILYKLAQSKNLWDNRIAMIATMALIKNNEFTDALKLCKIFINHPHDLIHKAVGWMLREIGNRNKKIETDFLDKHFKKMPRTMLRYAIEKFTLQEKKAYMQK